MRKATWEQPMPLYILTQPEDNVYRSCSRPSAVPDICIRVSWLERMLMLLLLLLLLLVPERVGSDVNQLIKPCRNAGDRRG